MDLGSLQPERVEAIFTRIGAQAITFRVWENALVNGVAEKLTSMQDAADAVVDDGWARLTGTRS